MGGGLMPATTSHADFAADLTVHLCDQAGAPVKYLQVRDALTRALGVDNYQAGQALGTAIRSRRIARVGNRGGYLWPPFAGPAPGGWVRVGAVHVPVETIRG